MNGPYALSLSKGKRTHTAHDRRGEVEEGKESDLTPGAGAFPKSSSVDRERYFAIARITG